MMMMERMITKNKNNNNAHLHWSDNVIWNYVCFLESLNFYFSRSIIMVGQETTGFWD
jgi:hypothetical protein